MTTDIFKIVLCALGGGLGWLQAQFAPTFPLIGVMMFFLLYDVHSAYELDKRVHKKYPEHHQREAAKFTSFHFGKTVREKLPDYLCAILLAFMADKWVAEGIDIHLAHIATGIIIAREFVSVCENKSSCREPQEGMIWVVLQKVLIDKTQRHLDFDLSALAGKREAESINNENDNNDEETERTI